MNQRRLWSILRDLYYRGLYDGRDIGRTPNDMFMGNRNARYAWEEQQISEAETMIIALLKPTIRKKRRVE